MPIKNKLKRDVPFSFRRITSSVWLFPSIVGAVLILLTCLRISGTSVGIYHEFFYGKTNDPSLIYGHPEPVRSDEWLVVTQLTIAQARSGFPRVNHNIGSGRDMSIISDVPVKDWSSAFKPQNFSFFLLPLEYAFAFKWWLMLAALMIGCYFFTLRLFPNKRALAVIASLCFSFSPFIAWWYQLGTIGPLVYGFFVLLIGLRIINNEPARIFKKTFSEKFSQGIYLVTLSYLLVGFGLILYPPFQIPIGLGVILFLLGYLLDKHFGESKVTVRDLLKRLLIFSIAAIIAGFVAFLFVHTRSEAISSIQNTVYPGSRRVISGGYGPSNLLATYLQPELQKQAAESIGYTNQSELSNFILLIPFLLLPGILLTIYEYRCCRGINWTYIGTQVCAILFFADFFIPGPQILYKLTLLDRVPQQRLIIGLGFIGFIHMLLTIKRLASVRQTLKLRALALIYGLICLLVALLAGLHMRAHYPALIHNSFFIFLGALYLALIITLLLLKHSVLALCLLLVISFGSVYHTDPLYRGLGPLLHNRISSTISDVSPPNSTWATVDDLTTENFAALSARDSISGVQLYPDRPFWKQVEGNKGDFIYNRYAHVLFSSKLDANTPLKLVQGDWFNVKFSCNSFVQNHVQYALTISRFSDECMSLVRTIPFPTVTYYIYKINK